MSGPTASVQYAWDGPGALGVGDDAKYLRWNNATGRFEVATVAAPDLSGYALTDASRAFTGAVTVNVGTVTAPFVLGANGQGVLVTGLNADLLDGSHAAAFAASGHAHSGVYLPIAGKAADSDLLDGIDSLGFSLSGHTHAITHAMLSATHTDATPAAVVRGDLITGQGATPAWARLATGTGAQVLKGGTEPGWGAVAYSELSGTPTLVTDLDGLSDVVITSAARGNQLVRGASNWANVAIGAAAKYWRSDGTDPSWQTVAYADISGTPTVPTEDQMILASQVFG